MYESNHYASSERPGSAAISKRFGSPAWSAAMGEAESKAKVTHTIRAWVRQIDAYWRASLYLCLGMLYLKENPLLNEPLQLKHTKPTLLGH
jgi:hypothetical protein